MSVHKAVEVCAISERTSIVRLERNELDVSPGICVNVVEPKTKAVRLYSVVAEGEKAETISLVVAEYGNVSRYLRELLPGDRVEISEQSQFFFPFSESPSVAIATGTGIAPIMSGIYQGAMPVIVMYGARTAAELAFREALHFVFGQDFIPVVSRDPAWQRRRGRVTDYLDVLSEQLEEKQVRLQSVHFYLCGLSGMLRDVSAWLVSKDVPYNQIQTELFYV